MSGKAFASQADLEEKEVTFDKLGDGLYAYTAEESAKVNAKLVLLLANHIGDADVLAEALALARPGKAA